MAARGDLFLFELIKADAMIGNQNLHKFSYAIFG